MGRVPDHERKRPPKDFDGDHWGEWVNTRLLRQAVEDAGNPSLGEIARRLGSVRTDGTGDSSRVARIVGRQPHSYRTKNGREPRCTRWVRYETAVQLVEVLGVDPVDYGV